ncbi:TRAP transporter small permease subunit [Ruegeria pomeroyi]|uniref:TRAP transporter small permease protein n=1 Tax=Ruegeria pomeroyi TaxID=89184 RepID=A0A9Q3WLN8_9RHOB|nr:TRAP transporter small permease subunit [Ruegeria pomeroyi]MCE8516851.1 TRAP transporter small permease subunit [Ruegeria pomeroyi]MCE8538203.1 TRAP transporter small permease subunit [Ruegeria pomeroyi]MCE8556626.1 TRAP transporter small permease subunit [Ruegeria pomeroyi]
MSSTLDERPPVILDEESNRPQRITDELPAVIGYPMKLVALVMRQIVMFTGFLMAFTFGAVVVIRYGFGGDLFAYEEWLLGISIVGFFAGAVLASARNLHINADILGIVIQNPRLIWWRGFVVLVVELLVILFLVYACYVSLLDDFSFPRLRATPVLRIPFVSWRIGIMIAFGFMAMFTAAYLYVHIRKGLGLPLKSDLSRRAAK